MKTIKTQLVLLSVFIFFVIISNSCCTKKYCDSSDNILYSIYLQNFTYDEMDTIRIVKFEKNTHFLQGIDSFEVYNSAQYYYEINIPQGIQVEYDYIIRISDKSYKISDFLFQKHPCNSCFPFSPDGDDYYSLNSYVLDGKKTYNNSIQIPRY